MLNYSFLPFGSAIGTTLITWRHGENTYPMLLMVLIRIDNIVTVSRFDFYEITNGKTGKTERFSF